MGVRLLSTFLRTFNPDGIQEVHLEKLRGKKIAVDISIYLYRFSANNKLIKGIYQMCSVFRNHNIHPLFIFDGKSDHYKKETINERRAARINAIELYNKYNKLLFSLSPIQKKIIKKKMYKLEKKMTFITRNDIEIVKSLLDAYGMTYIQAKGEADALCAALTLKNTTYACLSEDTDMFVYGCPRVLRYFSIIKHTVVLYDLKTILKSFNISFQDFRHMCILSGTDYSKSEINIFGYYELYNKFILSDNNNFLEWILPNQNNDWFLDIERIYTRKVLDDYSYILIRNRQINFPQLKKLLKIKTNNVFTTCIN